MNSSSLVLEDRVDTLTQIQSLQHTHDPSYAAACGTPVIQHVGHRDEENSDMSRT